MVLPRRSGNGCGGGGCLDLSRNWCHGNLFWSLEPVLEEAKTRRIAAQIEPDGRQPLELKRTRSFDYSLYNLEALFALATLGEPVGVDLWTYRTPDGRGIRKALDWPIPYATGEKHWSYDQITRPKTGKMAALLRRAANAYHAPRYEERIGELTDDGGSDLTDLLYPPASDP